MLKSIEKALALSEIREKLNDLNTVTDPTDAQQTEERELIASLKTTEIEYRAALTEEADEHATVPVEDREYREVLARGNVGRILTAFVEHRNVDGAEAEIQQHRGLASNQIPLDMLRAPVEHRAVTTGPTSVGTTEQPAIMPVFARGVGAFIGADRPTVDAGLVAYPVLDQRPTVGGPHTDNTSVDETTGSFSSELLTPGRIQASYFYKRVDAARFSSLDLALRQALNGGLEEKLDQELIAGDRGSSDRYESPESRGGGGDDVRGVPVGVWSLARRRPVCGRACGRADDRGGRDVRAHGCAVPQQQRRLLGTRRTRPQDGRRPCLRTRAGVGVAQTERSDSAGSARPGGSAGVVGRRVDRAGRNHQGQNRGGRYHGDPAGSDKDPAGGFVLQAGNPARGVEDAVTGCRWSGLRCRRQG